VPEKLVRALVTRCFSGLEGPQPGTGCLEKSEESQDAVIARVEILESVGPGLGRPLVDNVHQSRHSNMKELRAEGAIRVLLLSILAGRRFC